ncbi:hypothetical protein HHI36_007971 [Cryptolaemus montrouzieri]|uniref:Uncharacterized protein n=1 Tax=Cryptolaemus montrouzieri TaxID=559131 RepID=A0ABD2MRL3_9CUCU
MKFTTIPDVFSEVEQILFIHALGERTRRPPQPHGLKTTTIPDVFPEVDQIVFIDALNDPEAEPHAFIGPKAKRRKLALQEQLKSSKYNDASELVDIPCNAVMVQSK